MGRPSKLRYRTYGKGHGAWVTFHDGHHVTLASGPKEATREEARKAFHALMLATKAPDAGIALGGLAEMFLDAVRRDLKPISYVFYQRNINSFWKHAGEVPAAEVRPHHVTRWLDAHAWGPTTRHGAISVVKRMFRWGEREGYLAANPLAHMERPTPRRREAIMGREQIKVVIDAVKEGDPFGDLLRFANWTGCRPSEAMTVEARHVDFDRAAIVMGSKTGRKTGRLRVIRLNHDALELCRRLARAHPEGPLFRNTRGKPWTRHATKSRFEHLRARLGLGHEATMESFRHRFITDALAGGTPIKTVAEIVGHADSSMIDTVYSKLHQEDDYLHAELDKIRPRDGVNPGADTAAHPDAPTASGPPAGAQEPPAAPPPPAASRTRRGKPRPGQR